MEGHQEGAAAQKELLPVSKNIFKDFRLMLLYLHPVERSQIVKS